jgi:hypothetical protein
MNEGYMTENEYGTAAQIPGNVVARGGYYDSGLWTGVYLGGESFRYATAKHYLSQLLLSPADRAFWTAQKNEAYARVKDMVAMYDRNVNIAVDWQTNLAIPPVIDLSNSIHPIDLGQGLINHGEPGMLMRSCTRVDDPQGIVDQGPNDRVVGPFKWKDGFYYWCNGSPSRDTYAGTIFGLITAFDMVSPDDLAMRHLIRDELLAMGNFLVKYGWNYPRPWGYVSTNHDFDNFISPLFVTEPLAQLNMTVAARHVANEDGSLADKLKWNTIGLAEYAVPGLLTALTKEIDIGGPHSSYYKFNLDTINEFNLMRLTTGFERSIAASTMAVEQGTIGDDVNAWFEGLRSAVTGEVDRREMAKQHLLQWLDYRANTIAGQHVVNSVHCGDGTIRCVPEDYVDIFLFPGANPMTFVAGTSPGPLRDYDPLPVANRVPTDFLWQRDSSQLDGSQPATHRAPGIDFLAPYWLLRWSEEVDKPKLCPLPPYFGPSYK